MPALTLPFLPPGLSPATSLSLAILPWLLLLLALAGYLARHQILGGAKALLHALRRPARYYIHLAGSSSSSDVLPTTAPAARSTSAQGHAPPQQAQGTLRGRGRARSKPGAGFGFGRSFGLGLGGRRAKSAGPVLPRFASDSRKSMIAFKALFLAAAAPLLVLAASVLGTDVTARELDATRYVSVSLEHFEPNATALQKRDTIQDCTKPGTPVSTCFLLGPNLRSIGTSIASFVKSRSEAQDCRVHTGAIDAVQWRYYTVSTNGLCDTTAGLTTIRGAIDAFLEEYVNGWCSNVCLRMSHYGAWTGYLSVSPAGSPAPADCGADNYDTCETHGDEADLGARSGEFQRYLAKQHDAYPTDSVLMSIVPHKDVCSMWSGS
ncbi:hypothetical protein B0H14DRAFT_3892120 [Mycena olivaceomarginata]|nr:hypothetical protein B0H14DRAFT_3892120 [Mycena olivaceomarginata]